LGEPEAREAVLEDRDVEVDKQCGIAPERSDYFFGHIL
jgi:hypothetical protein